MIRKEIIEGIMKTDYNSSRSFIKDATEEELMEAQRLMEENTLNFLAPIYIVKSELRDRKRVQQALLEKKVEAANDPQLSMFPPQETMTINTATQQNPVKPLDAPITNTVAPWETSVQPTPVIAETATPVLTIPVVDTTVPNNTDNINGVESNITPNTSVNTDINIPSISDITTFAPPVTEEAKVIEETTIFTADVQVEIENSSAVTKTFVVENSSVVTETPVVENSSVVTETPVIENSSVVTETPVVENSSVVTETPVVENSSVVTETPVIENSSVVTETPVIEKTPVAEQVKADESNVNEDLTKSSDAKADDEDVDTSYVDYVTRFDDETEYKGASVGVSCVFHKLNSERHLFEDEDNTYVIYSLISMAEDDQALADAIMKPEKSYAKAFEYFANKSQKKGVRVSNGYYLSKDKALELAIEYFFINEELEEAKKEEAIAQAKAKANTTKAKSKAKTKAKRAKKTADETKTSSNKGSVSKESSTTDKKPDEKSKTDNKVNEETETTVTENIPEKEDVSGDNSTENSTPDASSTDVPITTTIQQLKDVETISQTQYSTSNDVLANIEPETEKKDESATKANSSFFDEFSNFSFGDNGQLTFI